ncbi:hypothetical protein P9255_14260 [Caballeronia sp. LZ019]|nr:hypothetical protein [Caballeronia sp. LZ019]
MQIECPARIDMQPAVVTDAPDGWQPEQRRTTLPVQDMLVTIGPPANRRDLKPEISKNNGRKSFEWRFVAAENDEGIWLSCGYGNTILLSRKLSGHVSRCRASESIAGGGYRQLIATCD